MESCVVLVVITLVDGVPRMSSCTNALCTPIADRPNRPAATSSGAPRTLNGDPAIPATRNPVSSAAFQRQTPRKCRDPPLVRKRDQERRRRPGKEKDRNGECYEDESVLAPRHLCSGSNEASGHLSDKQTKQTQKRATVDVARNKAQEQRGGSCIWVCSILLLSHGGAFPVIPGPRAWRAEPGIHNHRPQGTENSLHSLGLWFPGSLASRRGRLASAPE